VNANQKYFFIFDLFKKTKMTTFTDDEVDLMVKYLDTELTDQGEFFIREYRFDDIMRLTIHIFVTDVYCLNGEMYTNILKLKTF
jgi:hypothetical protein